MPRSDYVSLLSLTRFEHAGWTERMGYAHSVVDYLFRWLGEKFAGPGAIDPPPAVTVGETCAVCGAPSRGVPTRPARTAATSGSSVPPLFTRRVPGPVGTVNGMENKQGAASLVDGWALEWLPAEWLEDGLEAREILARGHPAGLIVHKRESQPKRNVLLGPIGQALGSPPDWLDGLDPDEAIETILQATAMLPPDDLEKALSEWDGLVAADE